LMFAATAAVAINSAHWLSQAFNPISLNVLIIAVASISLVCIGNFPSAHQCIRKVPERRT
jgi:hypothetical protein